jgi:hypothetical protein
MGIGKIPYIMSIGALTYLSSVAAEYINQDSTVISLCVFLLYVGIYLNIRNTIE